MELERRRVLHFLVNQGVNDKNELITSTGMSRRSVEENLKKINAGQGPERKIKTGVTTKLKPNDRRRLYMLALIHPKYSCKQLAYEIFRRGSPKVSHMTIYRTLQSAGIKKWNPKKSPPLTEKHKKLRLEWCLKHKDTDWTKVIFTDESYVQLSRNKIKMWGRNKPSVSVCKYGPKVLIWGGLSYMGLTPIKVAEGNINSDSYQAILSECLIDSMKPFYPDGFILQQDNAPPHVSKSTKKFLEANQILTITWPAISPDLNPIENLWAIIKHEIEKQGAKTLTEIKEVIESVWEAVTAKVRESLINSMSKRIELCIKAKGEKIKY